MRLPHPMLLAAALLTACGPQRPDPVPVDEARSISLVDEPFAELEVPEHNRPEGKAPPERVALGPWRPVSGTDGKQMWATPLPIRTRTLFHSSPPAGMRVVRADDTEVPHRRYMRDHSKPRWAFNASSLKLIAPLDAEPLNDATLYLEYPRATQREAALNLAFSGVDEPADFVRTSIQDGPISRAGLLLPAPGVAAWDVTIPPAGELYFTPGLVRPEILDAEASDGATMTWQVEHAGTVTEVWSESLAHDDFEPTTVDLSQWAGESIRLRLRTDPGDSTVFDYAFAGDPKVASRSADPQHVIIVFVDTLRPDHLGLYGYERDTSPHLDALASRAVVFDQARSVAPWTLPTARSMLTGRHPELWDRSRTVQQTLSEAGWATAMFAGNLYLSANFEINRHWALHRVVNWPPAEEQVDHTLDWLEHNENRNALAVVHFMDSHLPYAEPRWYRSLWAGEAPDELGERFHRGGVVRHALEPDDRQYVVDRYDGTIRYVDDQLERLLATVDDNDVVVFVSDHGEEFWEHGGFEHGHTLYDEVLRVPLVIKAPGLAPTRVTEPVSLLDLAPTLLDLAGVEGGETDGVSLVPAMRGDEKARAALAERPQAFGRMLYGDTRWGALHEQRKYLTHHGREHLYDLTEDPAEQRDVLEGDEQSATWRGHLGQALGTEVHMGMRLQPYTMPSPAKQDFVARLVVPAGIRSAYAGDDPTAKSAALVEHDDHTATITWPTGFRAGREVFVVPDAPMRDALPGLQIELEAGGRQSTEVLDPGAAARHERSTIGRYRVGGRSLEMTRAVVPLPFEDAKALQGYDAELVGMLRAMGYAVGSEQPAEGQHDDTDTDSGSAGDDSEADRGAPDAAPDDEAEPSGDAQGD